MNALLSLARLIDAITDKFGTIAKWAVLLSCLISALNAVVRYGFDYSSNAYLEIQWYLFAACVMLGAAQVLRVNEHVRVDVLYGLYSGRTKALIDLAQWYLFAACVMLGAAQVLRVNEHVRVDVLYGLYSGRTKALIDLAGLVLFLMPVMLVMIYYSWPLFVKMYVTGEMSSNASGLIRWPAMLMLPLGFALLLAQGASEIIKRAAWLAHKYDADFHYERPLQ